MTAAQRGASIGIALALLGLVAACSSSSSSSPSTPHQAGTPTHSTTTASASPAAALPVAHRTVWLCQPAMANDPCDPRLDATVVHANGSTTVQPAPPKRQPVDCFYVYPTVSRSPTAYAPLRAQADEKDIALAQAARFSSVCRVFAPVYRQSTVTALLAGKLGTTAGRARAYNDIESAFNDYLNHNPGRRFVLIGHSQGSIDLTQLIASRIDTDPALRARMVSAILPGALIKVPPGKVVGGSFTTVPLCTTATENGCVITYNSYESTPPPTAIFGRTASGLVGACTNPASLSGGVGMLEPYLPVPVSRLTVAGSIALPGEPHPTTTFLSYPGYVTGECKHQANETWLQVTVTHQPGDVRPATIPNSIGPAWGLHLFDINIALGNLVSLVREQSR